mmetsp:Transcript_112608/g.257932  ORF Transcript_112608/g.257932 Transcript_112608/m.257932 type:complete len:329 (+) Transcript_112608:779-1765(+)
MERFPHLVSRGLPWNTLVSTTGSAKDAALNTRLSAFPTRRRFAAGALDPAPTTSHGGSRAAFTWSDTVRSRAGRAALRRFAAADVSTRWRRLARSWRSGACSSCAARVLPTDPWRRASAGDPVLSVLTGGDTADWLTAAGGEDASSCGTAPAHSGAARAAPGASETEPGGGDAAAAAPGARETEANGGDATGPRANMNSKRLIRIPLTVTVLGSPPSALRLVSGAGQPSCIRAGRSSAAGPGVVADDPRVTISLSFSCSFSCLSSSSSSVFACAFSFAFSFFALGGDCAGAGSGRRAASGTGGESTQATPPENTGSSWANGPSASGRA